MSREFVGFFFSGPAMCKGIFVSKMLILWKESLGENLGPAENDEGVFCNQSQNFPTEVAVNIEEYTSPSQLRPICTHFHYI